MTKTQQVMKSTLLVSLLVFLVFIFCSKKCNATTIKANAKEVKCKIDENKIENGCFSCFFTILEGKMYLYDVICLFVRSFTYL